MNTSTRLLRTSFSILLLGTSFAVPALGQRFIDPNKGSIIHTKKGIMDGNFVRTIFFNHGEIAHYPDNPSGEWPKGTGRQYLDGVAVIVQAETTDSTGQIIHPLETNYREFIRTDPVTKIPWGWAPLPGYANATQTQPAMSNNASTWPKSWPDRSADWDGLWNGHFGRGIQNADVETYFRMDDSQDKGYPRYRPVPTDTTRGGLGIQVAVRGFQWSQVLAADVVFWYYEVTNVAARDYTKTVFAQYVDWGIGGTDDSSDDRGLFDKDLDIAWAFDGDGIGQPANWSPVGVAGYAFLESPGIATNGLDDDNDGYVDESRDNDAGTLITGRTEVINALSAAMNTSHFLPFYNYTTLDDVPAVQQGRWWTGDENANWFGFSDIDLDGIWDEDEPLRDDVGSDGLAPFEEAYTGPDHDGTQGNGRPDQGEPGFGILDKDESDQIGLTGFKIFPVHFYELLDDEQNWSVLTEATDTTGIQQLNDVNLGMYFAAGARPSPGFPGNLFPLGQMQTERFSMALLFGDDRGDLVRRKRTVQQIYNANYRFAKPPDKPRLIAVPGDRKVTLYWDDQAERSFDPFLQQFDFEGYRVYKSTEASFLENLVITDAYGKTTLRKPLVQFDLVDSVKGLHPIDINGVKFDLGTDAGLKHTYVDTDVQNGQTYYYAVVSYDKGFYTRSTTGEDDGIPPSECTSIIRVDINGNATTDFNTAAVTPRAPAAGYVGPGVDGEILHNGPGTGRIEVHVLNSDSIRSGHIYSLLFENSSAFQNDASPTYRFVDETAGRTIAEDERIISDGQETPIVDGLIGYVYNDGPVKMDASRSAWTAGTPNTITRVDQDPAFATVNVAYPADYELRMSNQIVDTSTGGLFFGAPQPRPVKFTIWNMTEDEQAQFLLYDNNNDSTFSIGDRVVIVFGDSLGKPAAPGLYRAGWRLQLFEDTTAGPLQAPSNGDVYTVATRKPFRTGEGFQFRVRAMTSDATMAANDLEKVAVVPNPYVGAASWEPQNLFQSGRGERRIFFVNLPATCTIRIYTISGGLVKVLTHNATVDNGQEPWNLVTKDGMDISYGVYVYHIEAPGVGEKIGTFAVIK